MNNLIMSVLVLRHFLLHEFELIASYLINCFGDELNIDLINLPAKMN